MFADFANDATLKGVDFLQVAYEVTLNSNNIFAAPVGNINMQMRQELRIPPSPEYANVITEMGICHSTSELAYIQKPSNESIINQVPDNTLYSSVDVMRLIITPHFLDTENVTIVGIVLQGRASCIHDVRFNSINLLTVDRNLVYP